MDQKNLIEDLKNEIASGRTVIVTGTGVSAATCGDQIVDEFHVACWKGLLQHGVYYCTDIEKVITGKEAEILKTNIDSGITDFLIPAAEIISNRLKERRPGAYHRWLRDSVGKLETHDPRIISILSSWPVVIATLNYDGLIEAITKRSTITWREDADIEDLIKTGSYDKVLHLHGYYNQPETIVLGLSSYQNFLNDQHTQAVMHLFTIGKTLVFIGCGDTFQDPNFSRLIEWGQETLQNSTHRHYILCRESEQDSFKDLSSWLYPVIYGKEYTDLPDFLASISPTADTSPPPSRTTPSPLVLSEYARVLRSCCSKLNLEAIDTTGSYYQELTLWSVFIPQQVKETGQYLPQVHELPKGYIRQLKASGQAEVCDRDRIDELRRMYLEQAPSDVFELIGDPSLQRLVILGDPGSGKSSLIKAIATKWAELPPGEMTDSAVPIVVELRLYARAHHVKEVSDLYEFLRGGATRSKKSDCKHG